MLNLIKEHKIEFGLVILTIILLILYTLRFAMIFDEDYSLLLSYNSFSNIIKLDSVDVHPPLYYFLLKIFIIATTFWTKSFLIRIISARILSVIISLISFTFLTKICKELFIKNNVFIQWLLYLLVPGVISFTYEFIKIRMYSLGALFIIIQLYELIKYDKNNKNLHLIISMIMTTLSLYTNYYTAMISGILLIIYMIHSIINKSNWIKILFSGLCSLVLFLPWLPILFKQLSLQSNHPIGGLNKQCIVVILILILFLYPLIWLYKYMVNTYLFKIYLYMFIINILLFIIMVGISFCFRPVFEFRYLYPSLLIYCFFGLNSLFIIIKLNRNKFLKFLMMLIISICSVVCIGSYINQTHYYGRFSLQVINDVSNWRVTSRRIIYLHFINNKDEGFDLEKALYLSNYNKYIKIPYNDKSIDYPNNIEMTKINPSYKKMFKNVNNHIVNN